MPTLPKVIIPIIAQQDEDGTWSLQDPGTTTVLGATEISFELQGPGKFFLVAIPNAKQIIFQNGANQWFFGTPGNPTGDATINPDTKRSAKYFIFWSDGVNKAHLDPKVVVKPGLPPPIQTAPQAKKRKDRSK